jgi:hypothetical protein
MFKIFLLKNNKLNLLKKFYNIFLLYLEFSKKKIHLNFSFNKKLIRYESLIIKNKINDIKIILNFLIYFFYKKENNFLKKSLFIFKIKGIKFNQKKKLKKLILNFFIKKKTKYYINIIE